MKRKLVLVAMGFVSFHFANRQFAKNNALYATGELNLGTYYGMDLNLNYILKDKYSFKVGYTGNFRKPKSEPKDFTTGVTGILIFGANHPLDQFENFGASVGRIYKLNRSGTIRANLSAGIGYTIYTEPENWKKITDNTVSLTKNYSYDYEAHKAFSLIINPKIEFPFTRYFGVSVSPMMQINKDRTYVGIGVGSMIGIVRQ